MFNNNQILTNYFQHDRNAGFLRFLDKSLPRVSLQKERILWWIRRPPLNWFHSPLKEVGLSPNNPIKNMLANSRICWPTPLEIHRNKFPTQHHRRQGTKKWKHLKTPQQSYLRLQILVLLNLIKNPKIHNRVWTKVNKYPDNEFNQDRKYLLIED